MGQTIQIVDNHMTDPAEILWVNPENNDRAIARYRGIFTMLDRSPGEGDGWVLGTVARPGLELTTFNNYERGIDGQTIVDVTAPNGSVTTFADDGGSIER